MDPISRRLLEELEQMRRRTGRAVRGISLARMMPMESSGWRPSVDIYESEDQVAVYADLAGVTAESLRVAVEGRKLHISGTRHLPAHPAVACVHQLEIELGEFRRTVILPSAVDADRVESVYKNGLLMVVLPKRMRQGKVRIRIAAGA